MRKASKIIMVIAMGATAFTGLAGMASAENEVSVRYGDVSVNIPGFGELNGDAIGIESRGSYDSGFRYDLDFATVDIDGLAESEVGALDVAYMMGDFGPAAAYVFDGDFSDGALGVGVAAEKEFGTVETFGSVVTDVEEFAEAYRIKVGGRTDVTDAVMLSAEYVNAYDGHGTRSEMIEFGARYTLVNNTYLDAKFARNMEEFDVDVDVVSVGLGFNF
jgi:hypothetical protein